MGIRSLMVAVSFLMVGSFSFAAPKKVTKLPAKKVAVKSTSQSVAVDVGDDIQTEESTMVEASPLEESASAKMRDKRRQMEMDTEEQMVQALENSRIEDEKTRRERVFGDRIQPVSQPVVVERAETVERAPVNEVVAKVEAQEIEEESSMSYYLGLNGGVVDSRANNVSGAGAVGFSLGAVTPLHTNPGFSGSLGLEAGFLYSLHEQDNNTLFGSTSSDIDQYNVSASAKYYLESGWFVPGVGLVMAYTRRQHKVSGEDDFSNAFDAGVAVSGDVALNKSVKLGIEYRYMTNVDYERERGPSREATAAQRAISGDEIKNLEAIDYQMILLNGKVSF